MASTTPFSCTIEFSDGQGSNIGGCRKMLVLLRAILPGVSIQHQHDLMGRIRDHLSDHLLILVSSSIRCALL